MSRIKQKVGECPECDDGIEKRLTSGLCSGFHYKIHRQKVCQERKEKRESENPKEEKVQKKIPRRSKKRIVEELQYNANVKVFLGKKENRICPVTKTPTTEVHHKKGRIGSLLLEQRYWLAVSREGHKMIENNPEWAKENGFSLSRLSKD